MNKDEKLQKLKPETLDEIASLSTDDFKAIKEEVIARKVIQRLEDVIKAIKTRNESKVLGHITLSCAGDGYGNDNYFINFSDIVGLEDIGEVFNTLGMEIH